MRKIITKAFVLVFALLAFQNTMAQNSSIFEETFGAGFGEFTVEGDNGPNDDIWSVGNEYVMADGHKKLGDLTNVISYLVSPEITLDSKDCVARFDHYCAYFLHMKEEVGFAIRENGGEWHELTINNFWGGMFVSSEDIEIPSEYNGKKVQFGFRYTATDNLYAGEWRLKNFVVEVAPEKPIQKKDPEIKFSILEVVYDYSDPNPFVEPEFYNPNNLDVTFTSDNPEVAAVDENGKVTIGVLGIATITATTPETDVYAAGNAHYTINVTDDHKDEPVLKDPELSFDVTEVVYEIGSEEPFVAPVLNNPHNVLVEYYTDDPEVADVNKYSGEVTIVSTGTTTIKVLSWDDDEYYGGYAKYTIKVVDPSIIYEGKGFSGEDWKGFTEEGEGAGKGIWMPTIYGGWLQANAFSKVTEKTETYVVSPEITLDNNGNTLSFVHTSYGFGDIDMMQEQTKVLMRVDHGEWITLDVPYPMSDFETVVIDNMLIPAEYNGKTIQLGFRYVADGTYENSGTWAVKDVVVRKINKKSPEISFEEASVEYDMNSGMEFVAPELVNPNSVDVTYSSSDVNVAEVDELTGVVTIVGEGVTTIKAVSAETDDYFAGEASYILKVSAGQAAAEVLFEESFAGSLGDFTEENADGSNSFWQWFFITRSAYATGAKDSRLVSPKIQLETENTVSFSYRAMDFKDLANEVFLSVREVGGEWTDIKLPVLDNEANWMDVEFALPAEYDNKTVQVAVKYTTKSDATLCIKNLVVKGVKGTHTSINGITAEDFDSSNIYDLQGRKLNELQKGINIVNGKKVIIR